MASRKLFCLSLCLAALTTLPISGEAALTGRPSIERISDKAESRVSIKTSNEAAEFAKALAPSENKDVILPEVVSLAAPEGEETITSHAYTNALYCNHPSVFHVIRALNGVYLTIEDGSVWELPYSPAWYIGDTVVFTQGGWFSSSYYKYCIVNQNRSTYVAAYLSLAAEYVNLPLQIVDIDPYNDFVTLNDGTVWGVFSWDDASYSRWQIGDLVVLGSNNGFAAYVRPFILINQNRDNYVRAYRQN